MNFLSFLFGVLEKWLFHGWNLLPPRVRETTLKSVGQWLPTTTREYVLALAHTAGTGEMSPPLDFLRRLYDECHPRLLYRFTSLGFRWLRNQSRYRAIDQKWSQSFPTFISIEPVALCDGKESGPRVLDGSLFTKLVHECKREGTSLFCLEGSEPLLHPRVLTLIRTNRDCLFLMRAHGNILSDLVIESLFQTGNVLLLLPLAGFQSENDAIMGENTYEATLAAMERLRNHRLPFGVTLFARSDNYRIVTSQGFVEHLLNQGIFVIHYEIYVPEKPADLAFVPTGAERREVAQRAVEIRNTHPVFTIEPMSDTCHYAGCGARLGLSLWIDVNGEIQPSRHIKYSDSSLGEGRSVREIVNRNGLLKSLRDRQKKNLSHCYLFDQPDALLAKTAGYRRKGFTDSSEREIAEKILQEPEKWSTAEVSSIYAADRYREFFQFYYSCLIPH